MDPTKQHVTLEPASSVSATGDSSGRFQSAQSARYAKNSHTDSTNVSYNMPTTVTGTETSDSGGVGYANNVCVHGQPARTSGLASCFDQQMNRAKGLRTNNKLSVMMFMPGIAAAAMHDRQIQPELYYAAAGLPSSSCLAPGVELRKRSNSFTQGQTMANFLGAIDVDGEHLHHHHQLLYQPPFVFNSEVAQRTRREQQQQSAGGLEQQQSSDQMTTDVRSGRMARQSSSQDSETTGESGGQTSHRRQESKASKGKVNFILTHQSDDDEEDEEAVKELNNNDQPEDNGDEMGAELASQCSVVMQVASGDEESQI